MKSSANTTRLVYEWRKSNHRVWSYCRKYDPTHPRNIAVESRCLSITVRNFLFHHLTLVRNVVLASQNIRRAQIVTRHSVHFPYLKAHGSDSNQFIHIASYDRCGNFVNFMIQSMFRKMTITSTLHHRFQHIICLFISFPAGYSTVMCEEKLDCKIKVHLYF